MNLNEGNIRGCRACEACAKDPGRCAQKDDLSPLLEEMKTCDAFVLGTPVYMYHASAQFKAFVDRLYCFLWYVPEKSEETKMVFPAGKKIVMVTSRAAGEEPLNEQYRSFEEWLKKIANKILEPASLEFVHHYESMNLKDSARDNTELMAGAVALGVSLV